MDGDGWGSNNLFVRRATADGLVFQRLLAMIVIDNNPFLYRYLTGYADFDTDGYTVIAAQTYAREKLLPHVYQSIPNGNDCDDDDVELYQLLAGYHDTDHDGFGAGNVKWFVQEDCTLRIRSGWF